MERYDDQLISVIRPGVVNASFQGPVVRLVVQTVVTETKKISCDNNHAYSGSAKGSRIT